MIPRTGDENGPKVELAAGPAVRRMERMGFEPTTPWLQSVAARAGFAQEGRVCAQDRAGRAPGGLRTRPTRGPRSGDRSGAVHHPRAPTSCPTNPRRISPQPIRGAHWPTESAATVPTSQAAPEWRGATNPTSTVPAMLAMRPATVQLATVYLPQLDGLRHDRVERRVIGLLVDQLQRGGVRP